MRAHVRTWWSMTKERPQQKPPMEAMAFSMLALIRSMSSIWLTSDGGGGNRVSQTHAPIPACNTHSELTLTPKCSVTPRPCSPSTPKDMLSSRKMRSLYLYLSFTWGTKSRAVDQHRLQSLHPGRPQVASS